jgi:hypothetical protein
VLFHHALKDLILSGNGISGWVQRQRMRWFSFPGRDGMCVRIEPIDYIVPEVRGKLLMTTCYVLITKCSFMMCKSLDL